MRRLLIGVALLCLSGCSVVDYFSRQVIARAGDHVLTAEWFAETMADGTLQIHPPLLERWAWLWVQYSLFLQRLADGDSMTDSLTVLEAMWPEVLTAKVARLNEQLINENVHVDATTIDSVYAAGDYRIVDHILIRTGTSLSASQLEQQRRKAQGIRSRLASGAQWLVEVQRTEDIETASRQGRLGVIERGQMLPEFEQAAYDLEPGGLSDVVETYYGFHILRRPTLDEVREEFTDEITNILADRWMDQMLQDLAVRRNVRLKADAADIIRDASARPLRVLALEPGRVIGEFDGGQLTDVGFVRWLQVLSREEHLSVDGSTEEELEEMGRRMISNELLVLEVNERSIPLTEREFSDFKMMYESSLRNLRNALGVDSLLARASTQEERDQVALEALERYMVRTSQSQRGIAIVPPLLATKLRSEENWSFFYGGLNRAVRLALELREARDSTMQ